LEPTGLGTDVALDALAQSCYDGDMAACDELWRESEVGSAYRNFGDTCAGRQQPNTQRWCEDAFSSDVATTVPGSIAPETETTEPPATTPETTGTTTAADIPPATEDPTGLGDDVVLNGLAEACHDGDMQACDDLFEQAPIGSPYMTYGDTCAGRQEAGTFNFCRVVFTGLARSD
jgi:hypothetical protein